MHVRQLGDIIRSAAGPLDLDEPTVQYLADLVLGRGPTNPEGERLVILHHHAGQLQVTVLRLARVENAA